jgi:SAM-dependent methyltransferase
MDDTEIENMAGLEGRHWWYRGLRDLIQDTLEMPRFRVARGARVLDAGCGTGENLRLLQELIRPSYCGGFDISDCAVSYCRRKTGASADVYVSDIRRPAFHIDQLDLILSCDVLSIAGLEASKAGLRSLVGRLRHGGMFIIHLPAVRWLTSSHDVVIGTRDRVKASQLKDLMIEIGLQVEFITYRVFCMFPAIVVRRAPSLLFRPTRARARSDLAPVASGLNGLLFGILRVENWMACQGFRFPWGSSVFAIGRRDRAS